MNRLTFDQQKEHFAKDCKLINLQYEYRGFIGSEKWAIVTELSEEDLLKKYPDVVYQYVPFLLLPIAIGEVINESNRNNDKYEKRAKRTCEFIGYEDELSERFYKTHPFEVIELERYECLRIVEINKVDRIMRLIGTKQRRRLVKHYLYGKSAHQIALEEGTHHSAVLKSIRSAEKKFREYYNALSVTDQYRFFT